jgi:outer membrane lipoprotein LolB
VSAPAVALRRVRLALAALWVVLVAACATLPAATGSVSYTGKFALVVSGPDRRETMSGRFVLTVGDSGVTLDLSTPLGTTVARVQNGPSGARVTVPSGGGLRTEQGPDPDALSAQVLGWTLPVSGIPDWIEGRPASGRPYRLDAAADGGSLLEQDGWTIRLAPRGPDGKIHRLDMDRPPTGEAPSVSLRVVLDSGARS